MAEIIENPKQFKVIKMTHGEFEDAFGGYGICDYCNAFELSGFYISVLNHWYCQVCYDRFNNTATNYPDDREIENRNFQRACELLKLEHNE